MVFAELVAKFKGDTSDWNRSLSGANADLLRLGATSVAVGNVMSAVVEKVAGLALQFANFAFEAAVATGRWAEQMQTLSQQTGLSEEFLINMTPALDRLGLSAQDLAMGFRRLSMNVKEAADPTSQAGLLFERLGINIEKLKGDPEQALLAISDAVKKLPPGFQRSAEVSELLGPRLQKLIPLLLEGSEGFKKSAAEANQMALALSGPIRQKMKDMDDALDRAATAWDNFTHKVGVASASTVKAYADMKKAALDWAAATVQAADEGLDKWAVAWTHMILQLKEGANVLFSKNLFSKEEWTKAVDNIKFIEEEAQRLINKSRMYGPTADTLAEAQKKLNQSMKDGAANAAALSKEQEQLFREAMKPVALERVDNALKRNTAYWKSWETDVKAATQQIATEWERLAQRGEISEQDLVGKRIALRNKENRAAEISLLEQIAFETEQYNKRKQLLEAQATNVQGRVALQKFKDTGADNLVALLRQLSIQQKKTASDITQGDIEMTAASEKATDQMIGFSKQLIEQSKQSADAIVNDAKAITDSWQKSLEAGIALAEQTGQLTPVEAAQQRAALEAQAIQRQIELTKQLAANQEAAFQKEINNLRTLLQMPFSEEKKLEFTKQLDAAQAKQVAAAQQATATLTALDNDATANAIGNQAKITGAIVNTKQVQLQAEANIIQSELRIAAAEGSRFEQTERLRDLRMQEINKQATAELQVANLTEAQITAIHKKAQADRMEAVKQFPTFWEAQLQAVVDSNAFSIASITTSWSSGVAQMLVDGKNFSDTMQNLFKSTAVAIIQGLINIGIQKAAESALDVSRAAATEAAKTGIAASGSAARVGIATGEAAATTTAFVGMGVAVTSAWEGVTTAVMGSFATMSTAIISFWNEVIIPAFVTIGTAIIDFLTAIAEAAADTIVGIPYAVLIGAGIAVMAAAVAAIAATQLAKGGIVTGPTLAMVGEAGPEAVIPLDQLSGFGGPQEINVYLDIDRVGRAVANALPSQWYRMGVGR